MRGWRTGRHRLTTISDPDSFHPLPNSISGLVVGRQPVFHRAEAGPDQGPSRHADDKHDNERHWTGVVAQGRRRHGFDIEHCDNVARHETVFGKSPHSGSFALGRVFGPASHFAGERPHHPCGFLFPSAPVSFPRHGGPTLARWPHPGQVMPGSSVRVSRRSSKAVQSSILGAVKLHAEFSRPSFHVFEFPDFRNGKVSLKPLLPSNPFAVSLTLKTWTFATAPDDHCPDRPTYLTNQCVSPVRI